MTDILSIDEAQRRISNWHDGECLDLSRLNLNELPHNLPVRLKYLDCNYNNITRLPDNLPPNLMDIYCNHTLLKILPDTLPATLLMLSCNNTQITFLPNTLPAGLREIYCNDTPLDSLPDILPTSLASGLLCYNTNIPFRRHGESIGKYYIRVKGEERERAVRRLKIFKEDLIEKTWNTYRVVDWCGVSFDW